MLKGFFCDVSLRSPFDTYCLRWHTSPFAQAPVSASQKCVYVTAGDPSGHGDPPPLSQGLSQKLAITEKCHESTPTYYKTQQTPYLDKLIESRDDGRTHSSSLQARVNHTFPEHSFLEMTSMTMQLRAPPGRAAALETQRDVSIARVICPIAATRRRRVSGKQTRCLVGATFDDFGTGPSAVGLLTQAATLVAVTAGAWWAARLASQQVSAVVWNLLLRGSSFIISQFAEWMQTC